LAWVGEEPPLREWWHFYLRRFGVDHWYRFAKQRLHWTLPRFGTPEQAERWSDLMPFITWELWLAREIVGDNPLPWQKPQTNLTPGRVCQGMGGGIGCDPYTGPRAQTPQEIARLAEGASPEAQGALSGGEKEPEAEEKGRSIA